MVTAALILAAGTSSRMGRPKQLLDVGGRSMVATVVAEVAASAVGDVVVVLGDRAAEVAVAVDPEQARVVIASGYAEGMAASLRAGLAALPAATERVLIVLGDQPMVTSALLDVLLRLHERSGLPAAAVSVAGLPQPPAVVDRRMWAELEALLGDTGLRSVLRAHPELLTTLPVGDEQLLDVDTPTDYARLRAAAATRAPAPATDTRLDA